MKENTDNGHIYELTNYFFLECVVNSLPVCLYVCVSWSQMITFEPIDLLTSFWCVCRSPEFLGVILAIKVKVMRVK